MHGWNGSTHQRSLMLILDVKTRWSSTYQMMCMSRLKFFLYILILSSLGWALDFSGEINDFVGRNRDLWALELDQNDWVAIYQVAGWLKAFRSATTEMSKMKEPMLSTVHAIFRGLQDHVSSTLRELLQLQMIKAIVNSRRFKGSSSDEPRRVQVLDLYCLTRFESEGSRRGDVY